MVAATFPDEEAARSRFKLESMLAELEAIMKMEQKEKENASVSGKSDSGKSASAKGGFDFASFQSRAKGGQISLGDAFEELLKIGGRDEWHDFFQKKMADSPETYAQDLAKMRADALKDKNTRKYKKIYEKYGRGALEVEFEEEIKSMPIEMKEKLFELQAATPAKNLHSNGKVDEAMQLFEIQYVKDKLRHTISLVDDGEFRLMNMLTTGEGLRIPPQAIIKKVERSKSMPKILEKPEATNKSVKQYLAKQHEEQVKETEVALRLALQKNDKEEMDKLVAKLKTLKGLDMTGSSKDKGQRKFMVDKEGEKKK